ncbi:hypothetical protein KVR01_003807 [Diaporthe batatas]|uniref:uncharacterized protein n=1 Tax=Diaporthe batatas TaxID=748121 RepID=UPI001D046400|nr:uncharacterized protein KVR01_003807 [Diaporthe batatas]KAG8168118.1 hypothetical protein KVR01_003807 [Diaporthe batatas]
MDTTRSKSFRLLAQQIYGPASGKSTNARDLIEELLYAKRHRPRGCSTSGVISPSKQPLPQDEASSDGAPTSRDDETSVDDNFHEAMRSEMTTKSVSIEAPTTDGSSATEYSTPLTSSTTQELPQPSASTDRLLAMLPPPCASTVDPKGPPHPPPEIPMEPCMVGGVSRIEQLEYLIRWKIMIFRQRLGVPYIFRSTQLWDIDCWEQDRRRNFFEKNGEEAYLARYINSDYVGRVEFHYIAPEEVY